MSEFASFKLEDIDSFKAKLVHWADQFSIFSFLDSNQCHDLYGNYDFIIGIDALSIIDHLENAKSDQYYFGYYGYNYQINKRNEIKAFVDFGSSFFFEPRYVIYVQSNRLYFNRNMMEALEIYDQINALTIEPNTLPNIDFKSTTDLNSYIHQVKKIQEKIKDGQFYELNYCIEFRSEKAQLNPVESFLKINHEARSPMSALVKINDKWALSFSPERLISLKENLLVAQPIKGTAKRDLIDENHDLVIKNELKNSIKERAENTMIVDLMRHDLTPYAETGSIQVAELCEIYSFPFVHQMISTIQALLKSKTDRILALRNCLPAGSMTGAPKLEVIDNIHELEDFHRGLYAGNIGYMAPNGDFDFNVVIRTLFYDEKNNKISYNVGSAITLLSEPEQEYEECLLKAEGVLKFFKQRT